jgi:hypothetical protein
MNVYVWHKAKPNYEERMKAIALYALCAYDLGTNLALVPKEDTKEQKVSPNVAENVPFRCFHA